jgi:hypothetical protein
MGFLHFWRNESLQIPLSQQVAAEKYFSNKIRFGEPARLQIGGRVVKGRDE